MKYHPILKSDAQITHDVTLRELILSLRSSNKYKGEAISFNNVKYFSLTLDGLLRDFDSREVKEFNDEKSFPVFFRPSYLLSKLVKVLPIKTEDYKSAFIKAVTNKSFNRDTSKSRDVLRIVNFLKSKGINDEKLIYDLISEEIFLEKYQTGKKDNEFNEGEFIESEINRKFKLKENELEQANKLANKSLKEKEVHKEKSDKLEISNVNLEEELSVYKLSLKKLKKEVDILNRTLTNPSLQSNQPIIEFDKASLNHQINQHRDDLILLFERDKEKYLIEKIKKWKCNVWYHLIWVIPIIGSVIGMLVLLFNGTISSNNDSTVKIIVASLLIPVNAIFIYLIKARYYDESNIKSKKDSLPLSDELKSRKKKLNI